MKRFFVIAILCLFSYAGENVVNGVLINTYADGATNTVLTSAKTYADTATNSVLTSAIIRNDLWAGKDLLPKGYWISKAGLLMASGATAGTGNAAAQRNGIVFISNGWTRMAYVYCPVNTKTAVYHFGMSCPPDGNKFTHKIYLTQETVDYWAYCPIYVTNTGNSSASSHYDLTYSTPISAAVTGDMCLLAVEATSPTSVTSIWVLRYMHLQFE